MSNRGVYDWKIIDAAKELSSNSQKEKFPYFMDPTEVFGLKIQVNRHVFSPKHVKGFRFFTKKVPDVRGKDVLEIGSGHGVTSCYLARKAKCVLATDISIHAVKNTRTNARLNGLTNLESRKSDVYSKIKPSEKFDIIYWNTPWARVPMEYKKGMSIEDYGMFDPEYRAISRFILEGKRHLKKNGALYLGFGVEGADLHSIEALIRKAKLKKKVISDDYFYPGERHKGKRIRFRLKLYQLK